MDRAKDILENIRDVWNNFIFNLKFFHEYYKFDDATKANHFGQILDHFTDSLHILESAKAPNDIVNRYAFNIGLLQTIYVHQNLVKEMHRIFKTGVDYERLEKDDNYSKNRKIRNELVGHPISSKENRKTGEVKVMSAVTLTYSPNENTISYVKYARENDFKGEDKELSVTEIIDRHQQFMESNLSCIYIHTHEALKAYQEKITEMVSSRTQGNFEQTLCLVEKYYETFEEQGHLYKTAQIRAVHGRKDEHPRFQHTLDEYLSNLDLDLKQKSGTINAIVNNAEEQQIDYPIYSHDFHYELSKLWKNRESPLFDAFYNTLLSKSQNNPLVIEELEFIKAHRSDEVAYYSACFYLKYLLSQYTVQATP